PGQVLVLKDGRKIPVTRLARRGGLVLFETARGERFSVAEDQVISPPLDSIPAVEGPPPPMPPAPAAKPETPTPPATPAPDTPARTRPKPGPPEAPGLPEFVPLPDRWSIELPADPRIVKGRTIDPYNQNVLKGDKPVIGNSVFLVLTGVLDSG